MLANLLHIFSSSTSSGKLNKKWGKFFTRCPVRTFAAGLITFFNTAFANLTHAGTEICLDSFHPTAHAIDVLRLDFVGVVHFAPVFSGSFAKFVIIVDGCNTGITSLAVKATMTDKLFHLNWRWLLCKYNNSSGGSLILRTRGWLSVFRL